MKKKAITVDFDETLFNTQPIQVGWGWVSSGSLEPIKRVHELVQKKAKEGYDIHVVTFRDKSTSGTEVEDLIAKHNLPIKSVVYTACKPKTPFLKKLDSKLHIDDDVEVCLLASFADIDVLLVDHGQSKKNETAKLFKKI
tara:strand:+ start:3240 stop:3659 length:420 start_codon:yes stop_codon:yes gene_type:complete